MIKRTHIRSLSQSVGIGMVAILLATGFSGLAASIESPGGNWGESPDWVASLDSEGTAIVVVFPAGPQPPEPTPTRAASIVPEFGKADSPFVGDYLGAQSRAICFDVQSMNGIAPAVKYLLLRGTSGREWYNQSVEIVGDSTVISLNTVSLDHTGWTPTKSVANRGEAWIEDLNNVAELSLCIWPGGQEGAKPQDFRVANMRLLGDDGVVGPAAQLTAYQTDALLNRFGVLAFENVEDGNKIPDFDKDGLSDYKEIIAGTAWDDAQDVFASRIKITPAGVVLTWRCVENGVYNILRSEGPGSALAALSVDGATDLTPTAQEVADGVMVRTDTTATSGGPYLYRIVKLSN